MKELNETLLAAQKEASRTPYVTLTVWNKMAGAVNPKYERLYTGSEPDGCHALAIAADGSLIRLRVTPPEDNKRLYRERVANPGPGAGFGQWVDTGRYDVLAVAACTLGNTVSVFWIEGDRSVYYQKSLDNGASWGTPEFIGSTASSLASGIAAAYKSNGDIAVFFTDTETLYLIKFESGEWQPLASWDKETGNLSGLSCLYDGDWDLLVTGRDTDGNYKLWPLAYGDGGNFPAGTWSELKELVSATSSGDYEFVQPFMAKADVTHCYFVEKFSGAASYSRPFTSHTIPGSKFLDNLWREPLPFNLSSEYGLAVAYHSGYLWLTCPSGVWRANIIEDALDLSADILSLKEEFASGESKLTVELTNGDGRYGAPGQGNLSILNTGCALELGLGYITSDGAATGMTITFQLDAFEHVSGGGKASLILHASGGWERLTEWRAHHQFRWNKSENEASVKDIISFILARAGISLQVKSASATIGGFFPDFTVHSGDTGGEIMRKLLTFVPDVLAMERNTAYLVNPQISDTAVYAYGTGHAVWEGRYVQGCLDVSHVQVEGRDAVSGEPLITDSFEWAEIERGLERILQVRDGNIGTVAEVEARGEAYLRKAEIQRVSGVVRVPLNCGEELYDVIEITDSRAGLTSAKRRVLGISVLYDTRKGLYEQKLYLGAV